MKLFNKCRGCGHHVLVISGIDMILSDSIVFHFCSDRCYNEFLSGSFPYMIFDLKEV